MEKTTVTKQCSCRCKSFSVLTSGATRAEVDNEGNLSLGKCFEDSIDVIVCEECGNEYMPCNFHEIL
jgi:hypothetical protein